MTIVGRAAFYRFALILALTADIVDLCWAISTDFRRGAEIWLASITCKRVGIPKD